MKISYDPKTDSLYIHLSEKAAADSEEVGDGILLDYDEQGNVVGIDLQHASVKFQLDSLQIEHLPAQTPAAVA